MKVYADHAATTKLDVRAFEAMKPFLLEEYGNASQLYSFARGPKKALKEARETVANCIGADPDEIYFTSGGTESDNWAIKGAALSAPIMQTVATSSIEHHAVLHSCTALARLGCPVAYLPPTPEGTITPETARERLNDPTRLVSVMYANNEIGTIQPIRKLAAVVHDRGALFHTDAVQAVGHVPIDVRALGVDLLSASAHKFNGPKGVGFLYIRNGVEIYPYADGGAQERRLRAGTENVAGIVGMATALKYSCDELEERTARLNRLENELLDRLDRFGLDYRRNGGENRIPGNLSLSFQGRDGEALMHRLDLMGVFVSTGSACNSKSTDLSHVLRAIGLPKEYAYGTIRISLGYENTSEEIEFIAERLRTVLER